MIRLIGSAESNRKVPSGKVLFGKPTIDMFAGDHAFWPLMRLVNC